MNTLWHQKNIHFTITKYSNIGSLYELGEIIKTFPLNCIKFFMKQLLTNLKIIYQNTQIPFKTLNHSDILFQQSFNLIPIGWSKLDNIQQNQLLYDCGEIMFYMITNSVPRVTKTKRFLTNKFWKTLQKSKAFNYFPKDKQKRQELITFLQKIIQEPTKQQQQRTLDKILSDNFFIDTPSSQKCLTQIKQIYQQKKIQLENKQKQQFQRTIKRQNKKFQYTDSRFTNKSLFEEEFQQQSQQRENLQKIQKKTYFGSKNQNSDRKFKRQNLQKPKKTLNYSTKSATTSTKSKKLTKSFFPPIGLSRSKITIQNQYPPSSEIIKFIKKFIKSKINNAQFFNNMLFTIKSTKTTTPIKTFPNKYTMKIYFTIIQPDPETGHSIQELITLLFNFNLSKQNIIGKLVCQEIHDVLKMKMEKNFLFGIQTEFQNKFYP